MTQVQVIQSMAKLSLSLWMSARRGDGLTIFVQALSFWLQKQSDKMRFLTKLFQIYRPKTFLYLMSLRTGTELITLSLLLNKVSGIYGLLALLTGIALSPLQLSMYIYSVLALILTALLAPHIRKQSPLECLLLAWFYAIDSLINACYTAAFGVTWFLVISQHHSTHNEPISGPGGAGKTIDETAGFTSPEYNVSHVDIVVAPAKGLTTGQEAVAMGSPAASMTATTAANPSLGHGVLQPESVPSIIVICLLWAVRFYFIFVVMAYARSVLRQYASTTIPSIPVPTAPGRKPDPKNAVPNPFVRSRPEGRGWRGRLGRAMVAVGRSYWFGSEDDDDWAAGLGVKFGHVARSEESGVLERERRRRSGTGPPPPPPVLPQPSLGLEVPRFQTSS
ncbi:MAG: hypothetical protein M1816_005604 [Peltula sp. TS41687]|nr:MAG: hypothetical protein M1816_005604 [Peltula sp. TS41687]